MKVFAKVMTKNNFEHVPVTHDLGIVIEHNGDHFTISEDNHGNLLLRSIDNVQLMIMPQGSNTVEVRSK